jgi:hypothetical protein
MPKGRALFVVVFCVFLLTGRALGAQEEEDPGQVPIESDWSGFMPAVYARGDKTVTISAGAVFPLFFLNEGRFIPNNITPGGVFSLAYNYFFGPHFFFGVEAEGSMAGTLGKNMFFTVPFGLRAGYQWVLGRVEIPVSLMAGGMLQKKADDEYFGLVVKPGVAGFFRFNSDFSFGINLNWLWVPQWTSTPSETVYGNFLETTLSVRYHF